MASKTTFKVPRKQSSPSRRGPRKQEAAGRGRKEAKSKLSKALGDAAREGRLRARMTQADVAERVGVATEVYGRLERGLLMPSVPTLRKLCLVLRLPADKLLALSSAHPPVWTETPPRKEEEEPQLRRLVRHLRGLTPSQLRALSLMAVTLRRNA
jgi:transcriptional regulator with XRE-family HTH domain